MPPAVDEGGSGTPTQVACRVPTAIPEGAARAVALLALSLLILTSVPAPSNVAALPTADANVPIDPGPTDDRYPSLAVDAGGALHVVRTENQPSPRGVYYSRSSDGRSWSPTVRVDGASGNASFPTIVVEREAVPVLGRAYVAYQMEAALDVDVWFVSSDDGVSWGAARRIDSAPSNDSSITPSIAATMGRLYAVWADDRDLFAYHVYFRASFDGGAAWGGELPLSTVGMSNVQPRIDAKGDTIAVAWRRLLASGPALAVARSDDAGASWTFATVSSVSPSGNLFAPDVFVDDMLVAHVAWIESASPPSHRAMYASSPDGTTWSTPVPVDDAAVPVSMRQASVSGLAGMIWVAWDDNRAGDYDTYASWTTDGLAWGDGMVDGNDLRLDDTDRNADPADDATIQVGPVLRTGGFGVYAVWDDARAGTYDTYATSVQVSPLVITEIQDAPESEARIEIYNFGRTAFDFTGATLYAGSTVVDLGPLGARPARSHVVVGAAGADLVKGLDLGTEGALVRLERGSEVLAVAGSGPYGIAPDPLAAESAARYAGTLDYVSAWTRSIASTFGARNVVPPPNLAPPVVLNEVLFNGAGPGDVFAELFARATADLTGYRLVADSVYTLAGGRIGGANPYAYFFESAGLAWWAEVDAARDNVYLYDAAGRLLDMFGWGSPHASGQSASRVVDGVGGTRAYDDPSALADGWAFDSVTTLALVGLERDTRVSADIGTTVQLALTAANRQAVGEVINVEGTSALSNWPVSFTWTDGTPLTDSSLDLDPILDLGIVSPIGSATFLIDVRIPIEAPLGDGNTVSVTVSAASKPRAGASVTLTIDLYPHFDITRTVSPRTVYLEGSGGPYKEVSDVTVVLEGAGIPVEVQVPQDVVFQIDESGSMNSNDGSNLRVAAVKSYIDAMRVDDRASLIGFTDVAWVAAARPLTYTTMTGKVLLKGDADTLACSPGCSGWTNIERAIQLGNDVLITQGDSSRPRIEILLTDGQCAPTPCTDTSVIDQAVGAGIVIFTIGLSAGADRNYLENIANRTGGRYYQAGTPQDLLQIYADIGTRINRTAGVDPNPTDATPMVEDALAPYLNVVPGSFVDPMSGAPRPPDFMGRLADRTILQWNVSRVDINETWAVQYGVTSTRLGVQDVALHPEARVAYVRWDESNVYQTIPQATLEVLAPPVPPVIVATTPAHSETNVALNQSIRVRFTKDMDGPSVSWVITPLLATISAWADARTLTLDHGGFTACTRYIVHVTAGKDLQGESLVPGPVPNPWSFTTVCPTYVRYTITRFPEWGDVYVDGVPHAAPAGFLWLEGETHDIEGKIFDPFGGSRLAFLSWSDGGPINHVVTVGSAEATITAYYRLQHPAALTLVGLSSAWPARVGFTLFSTPSQDLRHDAFASWVDDGSPLFLDSLIGGITGERFVTRDPTVWLLSAPLAASVRYLHQFTATVRVEGLEDNDVSLHFVTFERSEEAKVSHEWNEWVDAGSAVIVEETLSIGPRERYRTLDAREWQVNAPLEATVPYVHQFRPRVVLNGTDAQHTVGATWQIDREPGGKDGLSAEWFTWADAGTTLGFDDTTSGAHPRTTLDPTAFTVGSAFDAIITYTAPAPPAPPAPDPRTFVPPSLPGSEIVLGPLLPERDEATSNSPLIDSGSLNAAPLIEEPVASGGDSSLWIGDEDEEDGDDDSRPD